MWSPRGGGAAVRRCGGTYAHVCTGARHVRTEFSNIVKPHGGTKASSCYVCGARAHARGITIDARGNNSSNGVAPESTSSRCACAHTNHHCPNTPPSPPYSRHRLHGGRADWAAGSLATCCGFDTARSNSYCSMLKFLFRVWVSCALELVREKILV